MWICRKIPMFWINKLLPEDGRVFLWNAGTYPQVHMALQPTRPTSNIITTVRTSYLIW
jgi:hypothetical protein